MAFYYAVRDFFDIPIERGVYWEYLNKTLDELHLPNGYINAAATLFEEYLSDAMDDHLISTIDFTDVNSDTKLGEIRDLVELSV